MGYKPHTRKGYAINHCDEIQSLDGVHDAEIINHNEEWSFVTFVFWTPREREAEAVYEDIFDWFTSDAPKTHVDALDDSDSADFDGCRGEFTVFYPT